MFVTLQRPLVTLHVTLQNRPSGDNDFTRPLPPGTTYKYLIYGSKCLPHVNQTDTQTHRQNGY